jgi:hypothetical protein
MDQEDSIAGDEHSNDEDRIHALMDQYVDEEIAARLEDEWRPPAEPVTPYRASRNRAHGLGPLGSRSLPQRECS